MVRKTHFGSNKHKFYLSNHYVRSIWVNTLLTISISRTIMLEVTINQHFLENSVNVIYTRISTMFIIPITLSDHEYFPSEPSLSECSSCHSSEAKADAYASQTLHFCTQNCHDSAQPTSAVTTRRWATIVATDCFRPQQATEDTPRGLHFPDGYRRVKLTFHFCTWDSGMKFCKIYDYLFYHIKQSLYFNLMSSSITKCNIA